MRDLSLRKFLSALLLQGEINLSGRHLHALLFVSCRTVKAEKQIFVQRPLAEHLVGLHLHLLLLVRQPITLALVQSCHGLCIKLAVVNRLCVVNHSVDLDTDETSAARRIAQQVDMIAGSNK